MKWLTANAHPLKSLQPGTGYEDLAPLREMLQGVEVVGLGEATHGSHEFHTVRHRFLEYMVKEMGFRVLAFESPVANAFYTEDAVVAGTRPISEATGGLLYFPWRKAAVRDITTWVYAYNQTVPDNQKVRVVGFDIQYHQEAGQWVEEYLRREQPDVSQEWVKSVQTAQYTRPGVSGAAQTEPPKELDQLQELIAYADAQATTLTGTTSSEEAQRFAMALRHLARGYEFALNPTVPTRDRLMADTIADWHQRLGPEAKLMVFGHNGHVSYWPELMGSQLKKRLGARYYSLGAVFSEGGVLSHGTDISEYQFPPAPAGFAAWTMHCAGLGPSLLDLRHTPKGVTATKWLYSLLPQYWAEYTVSEDGAKQVVKAPLTLFDGIYYLPVVTASKP